MTLNRNVMQQHIGKMKNNFLFHFSLIFIAVVIFTAMPLPSFNELLYLILPAKQYNPAYLLNDWTLSEPWRTHYIFNLLVGPLTLLLPLEIVGWLGRIICWTLLIIALFRLGLKFQIPLWMVTLSIFMWLLYGQSLVAGEWIFGGFEAKCVAYIFFLFSLNAFIKKNDVLASILLGLTFSFHPSVGLFSILSIGLSLLILYYPFDKLIKVVFCTAIFSTPGIISLLPIVFSGKGLSPQDAEFEILVKSSEHLDPFSWPQRTILLLYILLLFNWMHFRKNKENQALKLCMYFQIFLGLFFSIGILCSLTENYSSLIAALFRPFPVFTLLFFFLQLMHAYHYRTLKPLGLVITAIGFIALLSFENPLGRFVDITRNNYQAWTQGDRKVRDYDITKTFQWIAKNTSNGSIVIAPPWRPDTWYVTQRAQIASIFYAPYDHRYAQWRERIEALVGKIKIYNRLNFENHYNNLTEEEIASIVREYGGEYLVSKGKYSYSILFDSGTYKVYSIGSKSF